MLTCTFGLTQRPQPSSMRRIYVRITLVCMFQGLPMAELLACPPKAAILMPQDTAVQLLTVPCTSHGVGCLMRRCCLSKGNKV